MQLTPEEQEWRNALEKGLKEFSIDDDYEDRFNALSSMRDTAAKLHNSLKQHGFPPKHHAYMIENRGVQPDDPEFYFHLHPIEDLVKFTYDPQANDDPVDKTIDDDFEFRVFTRRWGHDDIYKIKRTASGWLVKANIYTGPCDKLCAPILYESLRHDGVVYPNDVGQWFEWLWQQAKDKGLSHDEVQQGLNDIAAWIKITEANAPTKGIWKGLA